MLRLSIFLTAICSIFASSPPLPSAMSVHLLLPPSIDDKPAPLVPFTMYYLENLSANELASMICENISSQSTSWDFSVPVCEAIVRKKVPETRGLVLQHSKGFVSALQEFEKQLTSRGGRWIDLLRISVPPNGVMMQSRIADALVTWPNVWEFPEKAKYFERIVEDIYESLGDQATTELRSDGQVHKTNPFPKKKNICLSHVNSGYLSLLLLNKARSLVGVPLGGYTTQDTNIQSPLPIRIIAMDEKEESITQLIHDALDEMFPNSFFFLSGSIEKSIEALRASPNEYLHTCDVFIFDEDVHESVTPEAFINAISVVSRALSSEHQIILANAREYEPTGRSFAKDEFTIRSDESVQAFNDRMMQLEESLPEGWLIFDENEYKPGLAQFWRALVDNNIINWELSIKQNEKLPKVYANELYVGQLRRPN